MFQSKIYLHLKTVTIPGANNNDYALMENFVWAIILSPNTNVVDPRTIVELVNNSTYYH